jgi:hypothetical protein
VKYESGAANQKLKIHAKKNLNYNSLKQSLQQICFFDEYLNTVEKEVKQISLKEWFKKIGIAGFLFFLIKGLVWIAVFIFAGKCSGL